MNTLRYLAEAVRLPIRNRRSASPSRFQSNSALAFLSGPEPMIISAGVAEGIENTVGRFPAEQGGMLGGRPDGHVERYEFDGSGHRTGVTYSPDTAALNRLMKERWKPRGDRLKGFVHSHPVGIPRPSGGDMVYADRILNAITGLNELYIPIVQSAGDGVPFSMHGFRASLRAKRLEVRRAPTVVLPRMATSSRYEATFERVTEAYDLAAMASTRLVCVGVGGAAAFVEEMARAGVGEFVLVDPDRVDTPNLATQQVYRRDLGRSKVRAVANRIRDINPDCRVWTIGQSSDALNDEQFGRVLTRYLPGSRRAKPAFTLLCGFTDSFAAQARVNRLALQFGVPMLAAQVYREGRGAEVTFSAPGVTPACGRCVLGGRYRAHLEEGFQNDVGSAGTPLFATTRLNATKAMIALALIHGLHPGATSGHPGTTRWAGLLGRIANRNLVQIRMDPLIRETLGLATFDRVLSTADPDRVVVDETVWLPQQPESSATGFAPCPDCGGGGDLTALIGAISDTVAIPSEWTS